MTKEQRAAVLAEMERRFRLRTPTTDPNYANPDDRVGRSEMVTWAREQGIPMAGLVDTVEDEQFVRDLRGFWRRMKRAFPEERW